MLAKHKKMYVSKKHQCFFRPWLKVCSTDSPIFCLSLLFPTQAVVFLYVVFGSLGFSTLAQGSCHAFNHLASIFGAPVIPWPWNRPKAPHLAPLVLALAWTAPVKFGGFRVHQWRGAFISLEGKVIFHKWLNFLTAASYIWCDFSFPATLWRCNSRDYHYFTHEVWKKT